MRISYSKQVIFLANPRCGSTSIRRALDPWSDVTGGRGDAKPLRNHASLRSVERYLAETDGPPLEAFDIFTTSRNPWDRVVSFYYFGLQTPASIWHEPAVESGSPAAFARHSILDWVFGPDAGHPEGPYDLRSFTTAADGSRPVAVFDLRAMGDVEAWLHARGMPVEIGMHNQTEHLEYRKCLDDEAAERIARLFATDIAEMGYRY